MRHADCAVHAEFVRIRARSNRMIRTGRAERDDVPAVFLSGIGEQKFEFADFVACIALCTYSIVLDVDVS